jgi:phenylacetate-CoA ligase
MDAEAIYLRLPIPLQNAVCSLHGWRIQRSRFSEGFRRRLKAAEERLRWPAERALSYRDARLRDFVRHAGETVPHYRRIFQNLGVRPGSIRGLADLAVLPILTKADVQADYADFLSESVPERARVGIHTSGTTGSGLRMATTLDAIQEQWAAWWRYRRLHGLPFDAWCGYFGGRSVVPLAQPRPPFWRYNRPGRQILFSGYHLAPATLGDYVEEVRARKPPWLHGYPSLLALLASYLVEHREALGYEVRWVTTGAESLLPQQAALIERAFGVRPIEHYGMAEAVANSSQCPARRQHVDEDFAAVEFIPTADGSAWRVIGTNFTNRAVPLIRYEVGDHVQLADTPCACGLPGRVLSSIDGRQEDYVVLRNGARLGRMDHIFKDMVRVREAQIYQDEPGVIRVRIVRNPGYTDVDERLLLRAFHERVGDQAEVLVEHADSLPRTATGKLRFVVSNIREAQLAAAPLA